MKYRALHKFTTKDGRTYNREDFFERDENDEMTNLVKAGKVKAMPGEQSVKESGQKKGDDDK